MRIFMLGWEFPPYISGGLGTACEGLTRALAHQGADMTFVLPRPVDSNGIQHVKLLSPPRTQAMTNGQTRPADTSTLSPPPPTSEKISFRVVPSGMTSPYGAVNSPSIIQRHASHAGAQSPAIIAPPPLEPPVTERYAGDLISETQRYADLCLDMARETSFDVIHAHDWLTYPAAMAVAGATGKPFVAHVHSTEFDRAGEHHIHDDIFEIERRGMHAATRVIAVSHLTRRILETRYDLDPCKIDVVYNGIDHGSHAMGNLPGTSPATPAVIRPTDKIVLFLGRITMQKGPEYFIAAAKKVLDVTRNVKFIMAGAGDKVGDVIDLAAREGIAGKVLFTGFLHSGDVHRVFKMADVFVMPSVSEPFGIAALEAIRHDVPVILSKQSGVSEVVHNALKVDFWDTTEMANKIIAVLRHPSLADTLTEQADIEVRRLTWTDAADKCLGVYDRAIATMPV